MKKTIIIPSTNPIKFAAVRVKAFEKISKSHNAIPIPETVAGGTNAAAIATPTKIPGMLVDIAIPPAIPSAIATAKKTGEIIVLERISSVNGRSENWIAMIVSRALVPITAANKIKPEIRDLIILSVFPTAVLKEKAEIGPSSGDTSIAPITKDALFAKSPTTATPEAITIMKRRFLLVIDILQLIFSF